MPDIAGSGRAHTLGGGGRNEQSEVSAGTLRVYDHLDHVHALNVFLDGLGVRGWSRAAFEQKKPTSTTATINPNTVATAK